MVCSDIECFEADAQGNYFPLDRYHTQQQKSPSKSKDFVRDVTDTFRLKVRVGA